MPEVLDVILTLIQSILLQYTVSCCSEEREIKNDLIIIMSSFVINYWMVKITQYLSILSILNIFWHFLSMMIVYYVYKNDKQVRIVNCSIFYIFNCIMVIMIINGLNIYMEFIDYQGDKTLLIVKLYFILYIFLSVIYSFRIKKICNYFNQNKKMNSIITSSFIIEFILAISNSNFFNEGSFTMDLSLLIGQMFMLLTSFYFFVLYTKSKKVFQVNKRLETKNLELKNIKDRHAEVIAYLQKIYSLDHKDQVGIILKEIINGNEDVICTKSNNNETSLINVILKNAINKGIKVDCDSRFDISLIEMNELELYRIITNIVNNAVRVLEDIKNPMISIRIYKTNMRAGIEIENNGPIIDKKYISKIFNHGFTTKENSDSSHGYGLSIVKELIENNNGTIEVISTEFKTIFKIVLPVKGNTA
ncbi:sensor histidine kinase [Clostridium butyricum]|uniref:Histidine kinase n=1 Tax=Clostridium butyricum TaxID=1492 RepID=A0A2S7F908_CLOBU|nr:ATP-binding protein [Clostridium butyricum]KHD16531.1 histidine kinase [Clostridium butyricum]PPV13907.1 histidine kinase [Clostridium butyricum]